MQKEDVKQESVKVYFYLLGLHDVLVIGSQVSSLKWNKIIEVGILSGQVWVMALYCTFEAFQPIFVSLRYRLREQFGLFQNKMWNHSNSILDSFCYLLSLWPDPFLHRSDSVIGVFSSVPCKSSSWPFLGLKTDGPVDLLLPASEIDPNPSGFRNIFLVAIFTSVCTWPLYFQSSFFFFPPFQMIRNESFTVVW